MPTLWIEQIYASPLYRVHLKNPTYDGVITGYLTSQLSITTESEWSALMDNPLEKISKVLQVSPLGRSSQTWAFTKQAWGGAEPVTLSFNLGFLAVRNAEKEVLLPAKSLLKWPLSPNRSSPMKLPVSINSSGCSIQHQSFFINQLLPNSVEVNWSHTFSKDGFPVQAEVSLSFKTMTAISAEDIENWFNRTA